MEFYDASIVDRMRSVLADRKFTERWLVAMSAKFTDQTECLTRLHPETEDEGAICDVARKF